MVSRAIEQLLEYNTETARIVRDYCEALSRELSSGEPKHDVHRWAIFTGQLEVLFHDTLQLYVSALRTDELHHYTAFTSSGYAYTDMEARLQEFLSMLHWLLVTELDIAAKIEAQGYVSQRKATLARYVKEVTTILAGESPAYSLDQFQIMLQQSLDDVHAGRLEEIFPES